MHHCKFALAVYSQTALQKTRKKDTKERSPPGWHDPLVHCLCFDCLTIWIRLAMVWSHWPGYFPMLKSDEQTDRLLPPQQLAVGRCHGGGPHHAWRWCTVGEAGGVLWLWLHDDAWIELGQDGALSGLDLLKLLNVIVTKLWVFGRICKVLKLSQQKSMDLPLVSCLNFEMNLFCPSFHCRNTDIWLIFIKTVLQASLGGLRKAMSRPPRMCGSNSPQICCSGAKDNSYQASAISQAANTSWVRNSVPPGVC